MASDLEHTGIVVVVDHILGAGIVGIVAVEEEHHMDESRGIAGLEKTS